MCDASKETTLILSVPVLISQSYISNETLHGSVCLLNNSCYTSKIKLYIYIS